MLVLPRAVRTRPRALKSKQTKALQSTRTPKFGGAVQWPPCSNRPHTIWESLTRCSSEPLKIKSASECLIPTLLASSFRRCMAACSAARLHARRTRLLPSEPQVQLEKKADTGLVHAAMFKAEHAEISCWRHVTRE